LADGKLKRGGAFTRALADLKMPGQSEAVALMKRLFGKGKTPTGPVEVTPPENGDGDARPETAEVEGIADDSTEQRAKKGILRRFESNIRRKVDGYVDNKAGALLDDATRRAQDFRQETLDAVREHAMELLDLTERRIDEKLVDVEHMLEERLRAELKMRLRALFWTLAFVLLMALISLGYVWLKQRSGLQPGTQSESGLGA
jgi:hypothetical protein